MNKKWEPRETKYLRDLKNASQRQIKVLIEKENLQYDQIIKMIKYYELKGSACFVPDKQAYIADNNGIIRFLEYEYAGKDDNNKDIFNVILAYVNKPKNKFDKLEIYTQGNSARYVNGSFMNGIESRMSPFGGSSKISSYHCEIQDKIEYCYSYADDGESYRINGITIIDNVNYCISYSKRHENKSVSCGNLKCTNGKIVYASFDSIDDFIAICELYKTEDISRVSDKCIQHVKKSRSLI